MSDLPCYTMSAFLCETKAGTMPDIRVYTKREEIIMTNTIHDVLEFVKENDVKFIRLSFCDLFGTQKNISIMSGELPSAFENGISFDAHAVRGFRDGIRSDLLLFPDPATLTVLPWRPGPGRVIRFNCDIKNPDKTAFQNDSRYLLKQVAARCDSMGYVFKIGTECEFYLFKTDEKGEPTTETLDKGGYFDISPLDKGENIRREICLCLEEMGVRPETSHHEQGPGQNEISFRFSNILEAADNLLTFKSAVKAIAARNGLFASFMPKPIPDRSGNGLHVNISLSQNGFNTVKNADSDAKATESFLAGVLKATPEMTLFLNPIANSYERFGKNEAPQYVSWSHQNRSQLIRIPAATGEKVRMELRSPDPSLNPYLAFALIISAGLDGIDRALSLPPAVDEDLYSADARITDPLASLPCSLQQALTLAQGSNFVKNVLGEEVLTKYLEIKAEEVNSFTQAKDKDAFYKEQYFTTI